MGIYGSLVSMFIANPLVPRKYLTIAAAVVFANIAWMTVSERGSERADERAARMLSQAQFPFSPLHRTLSSRASGKKSSFRRSSARSTFSTCAMCATASFLGFGDAQVRRRR